MTRFTTAKLKAMSFEKTCCIGSVDVTKRIRYCPDNTPGYCGEVYFAIKKGDCDTIYSETYPDAVKYANSLLDGGK